MPRKYKRKSGRGQTPLDVLERASEAVSGGCSIRSAARDFAICRMTLKRFIEKRSSNPSCPFGYTVISSCHAVFDEEKERDLAEHITSMADQFHGLSLQKCLTLAYEFAKANKLPMPENWEKDQKAGKAWWQGFKERQNLSIRNPEATSIARATAFNKPVVERFYNNLIEIQQRYRFEAKDIFNTDETGCSTVQVPENVVTRRGKRQVGSLTSAERGTLVTAVYTVSASGNTVPPMLIFPRVGYKDHFIKGAPSGTIGKSSKSGWMNEGIFPEYLEHVARHVRCTPEKKILMILDNHESHISIKAIDKARELGIVLFTIPPHCSHRLQPLDRTVFGPFKAAYYRAMDNWLTSHPGKSVTIYDVPDLVKEAQMVAITQRNILSGFQSTGIYPLNTNLFTEVDFAPARVTDRPLETETNHPSTQNAHEQHNHEDTAGPSIETTRKESACSTVGTKHDDTASSTPESTREESASSTAGTTIEKTASSTEDITHEEAGSSVQQEDRTSSTDTQSSTSTSPVASAPAPEQKKDEAYVSPSMILPFPRATGQRAKRGRKKGSSRVFTDTPVRNEIAALKEKKTRETSTATKVKSSRKSSSKRSLFESSQCSSDDSDGELPSDYFDESDSDCEMDLDEDVIEGDFVIVQVHGKKQTKYYIARVDAIDGYEYEGIFLRRLTPKIPKERSIFVVNEEDPAFFDKQDIIHKLPTPRQIGGTTRRACQLTFNCNLQMWNIA